jgi:hypothetical protein
MFVTLAKSSSSMSVFSSSKAKAVGAGGGKSRSKERKESAAEAAGGGTDEETANALALNLFISDTADAVERIIDTCVQAGELQLRVSRYSIYLLHYYNSTNTDAEGLY